MASSPNYLPIRNNGPSPKFLSRINQNSHRYAVCITISGHLHFEISWSNTRLLTSEAKGFPAAEKSLRKRAQRTLPLCWIYSFLGYSRRGWGLLRTTTLHQNGNVILQTGIIVSLCKWMCINVPDGRRYWGKVSLGKFGIALATTVDSSACQCFCCATGALDPCI